MRRPKLFIALLRVALGWMFLYQGIVAITQSNWTLAREIANAQTFPSFYTLISTQPYLGYASGIVKALFVVVGVLLIFGLGLRLASLLGILLMVFFYLPLLHFPRVGTSYYIIDGHAINILILMYLFTSRSSESIGLGSLFRRSHY